ncbi:MAG: uncharacterized protein KVP18_000155 [Porospora cf. gigantea A]|uniref:uncharacterized protein n=1 Tax=Porospora cf. gigantea A TaxID=2853593 RepID=UPI00355A9D1B|nr:MAG: hypothetical protein KVP18_000155 [Porospora cf. gigantea A]
MDAESRKVPKELGLVDLNEVLLHVLPITEIYRSRSHDRVEFDYATKSRVVRLNAVAFFPIGPPPRRPDLCPLVLSTELDGSFGCVGTLDQNRVATIHFPNQYRLQPVEVEGLRTHWQTVEKAAKALERNVHLVRKMFGNVRIRVGSKRELFDIGLGFTTTVDQETSYATGLAKLAPGGMTLYSNEALNAFRLMDERWTFVLNNMEEGLQKRNGRINADMAFKQDDMEIKPLVEQFISWKMQQPFSRSLFQPATGRGFYESLSVVGVEGLDSIATWGPPAYSTTKTKHYHADNGLRPPTNIPTQRSWMKKPGVRVVYSKFRGILPVGTQGTVIGVYPTLLVEDGHSIDFKLTFGNSALMEVLLDMPSLAGSRLGDRAPPLRGVVAPASHFMAPLRDNRGRGRGDNRGRGRGDNRGRGRGDNRGRGRGDNRGRGRDDSSVRGHGDSRGRGHGEGRNDSGGGSHGRGRGRGHQHNNDTNGNKRADAH